jgi:hemolysin III
LLWKGATRENGVGIDTAERAYSRGELVADRTIHLVGLSAGIAGVAILVSVVLVERPWVELATVITYSVGLVAMLSLSAAYNMLYEGRYKTILRRLDHAAIFLMIAGTYTPFTINGLTGAWSIAMTATVWSLAGLGIAMKLFAPLERSTFYSTILYLSFGWIGLIAIGPLLRGLSVPVLILLGVGGLLYSVGVVFHALQRLPYQNAIWHGFVLAAAAAHFAAVSGIVLASD